MLPELCHITSSAAARRLAASDSRNVALREHTVAYGRLPDMLDVLLPEAFRYVLLGCVLARAPVGSSIPRSPSRPIDVKVYATRWYDRAVACMFFPV